MAVKLASELLSLRVIVSAILPTVRFCEAEFDALKFSDADELQVKLYVPAASDGMIVEKLEPTEELMNVLPW